MKGLRRLVAYICCLIMVVSLCPSVFAKEMVNVNTVSQMFFEEFRNENFVKATNFSTSNYIYSHPLRIVGTLSTKENNLKVIMNTNVRDEHYGSAESLISANIKFDQAFDVSTVTNRKLIISFNIKPEETFFRDTDTSLYNSLRFNACPIYYDEEDASITVLGGGRNSGCWSDSVASPFLIFKREVKTVTDASGKELTTYGDVVSSGIGLKQPTNNQAPNYTSITSNDPGRYFLKNSTGTVILNKPIDTVYTVTYEITPGANLSDKTLPRITKCIMTDGVHSIEFDNTKNTYTQWDLTQKTISGMQLGAYSYGTSSFDNLRVYYETETPESFTVSASNGNMNWVKDTPFEVNFNGCIDPKQIEQNPKMGIKVEKVGENNSRTDITERAVFDWNFENTKTVLKIDVLKPTYITDYVITVPSGLKAINSAESFAGTITYRTEDSLRKEFDVIQTAGAQARENTGGFAMVADFEDGWPEKVYFHRESVRENLNSPFEGSVIAAVINPEGKVVKSYDLSQNVNIGDEIEIVLDIPESEAMKGPWTFRMSSSFVGNNGDKSDPLTIGLKNPKNWGVRGEYMLYEPSYNEEEAWVYVPEKVNDLFVSTSDSNYPVSVYTESGDLLGTSVSGSTSWYSKSIYENNNIGNEAVYRLDLKKNNKGEIPYSILVDYAPSLICPTKEMAWALKGGWQTTSDGLLVQGGLQKSAREEILRIYNKYNRDMGLYLDATDENGNIINDPENGYYVKPVLNRKNKTINGVPYEESERLLGYLSIGAKRNFTNQVALQNMDVNSPYFGSFTNDEDEVGAFEQGKFKLLIDSRAIFAPLVVFDHPYNIFYNSKIMADRQALACLAPIVGVSEDFYIKDNDISSGGAITHGNFYYSYLARDYDYIRPLLDDQTVGILDEAMRNLAYSMGTMFGRGPSNQWFLNVNGVTHSCYTTGDPIVKNILNKHLEGMGKTQNGKGLSPGGYFIEGYGSDGANYHLMCQSTYYMVYKNVQMNEPDNPNLDEMKDIIEMNLQFTTLFETPKYGAEYHGTNAATARTDAPMRNTGGHVTYMYIFDEIPLAMRIYELSDEVRTPSRINENIVKYAHVYSWDRVANNSILSYNAVKNFDNGNVVEAELMPAEKESGIWGFEESIIGVKNKGLFMTIFYDVAGTGAIPTYSYMGGGMSLLFADNVGGVVSSRKPVGCVSGEVYSMTDYDQMLATCIVGEKVDGTLFYTGKEKTDFVWLEENKKFEISGTDNGIDIAWIYDITDSGITMTAKASDADKTDNVSNISEAWVNIPIAYLPNDEVVVEHNDGRFKQTYREESVEFTWDSALDSEFSEIVDSDGSVYHTLRIKLPSSGEVSVDIENLSYGKSDEVVASNEKKYEWISNSKYQETEIFTEGDTVSFSIDVTNKKPVSKDVTVILKAYSENNEILDVFSKTANIEWYKINTIKVDKVKLPAGTKYIDVLLWENFGTLKPYVEPSIITVEKAS